MYDLHTHSTVSDGAYSPAELVRQAATAGVTHLALTDHDCTDGLAEAQACARACGIRFIPAVEISTTWLEKSVHVVGLNIDPACRELREGLARLQAIRLTRAEEIGRRLAKRGIQGAFEAARERAGMGMITRTHFAHFLAEQGLAASVRDVFDHYLVRGKPGYVPTQWAGLEEAVSWIKMAGGVAVLAHPQRYKFTGSWLGRLLLDFKSAGGEAVEVIAGTASPGEIQSTAAAARRYQLMASVGSDFHNPDNSWLKLGRLPELPPGLTPVWSLWDD
ncbi:MAG: PHP domain-containing protein [Methylococcaceae bacterium]|nr:PHP domain-containing protein [Methylococcaceae bacterium]